VAYEGADDAEHKVGPRTANAGDDAVACEAAGDIECGFGPSTNGLRPPGGKWHCTGRNPRGTCFVVYGRSAKAVHARASRSTS
jgi:hypothetical protein